MSARRLPVAELTRQAFIHAELDRLGYADCVSGAEREEALDLARQFAAYRRKRWGLTDGERQEKEAKRIPALSLFDNKR